MQKEIRAHPARYKVIDAGRRWGKTRLGLLMCLETALAGGRTWWVGLTYKSLRPAWRDLARIARQIGGARIQESDLLVTFPNGGEVMARTAEDPVNLRGEGLDGVVIDEAAHLKQDVWDGSIRPSLMDRAGWAILISSPAGMNWFHDLWQLGQQDTDGRWASWQRPSTDNTFLSDLEAEIEDARRSSPDFWIRQEYLAEFINYAGLRPFRADSILYWPDEKNNVPDVLPLVEENSWAWDVRIGVDQAISMRDTACRSAIVVAAQCRHPVSLGDIFVLHADAGHWTPFQHADKVLDAVMKYGARTVIYEKVAYQTAFEEILGQRQRERHISCGIQGERPDLDKLRRANAWAGLVEGGRVYIGPGQSELVNAMCKVPPESPSDAWLWDLVDAAGIVIRTFPDVPAPAESIAAHERGDNRKKLATSYATKSGSTLLPDQVPRPFGTPAGGRPQRFSIPHGTRLDGGTAAPTSTDPRRRAIGYSVRPSRLTTARAPGRA